MNFANWTSTRLGPSVLALAFILISAQPAASQSDTRELRVGVIQIPPLVIQENGRYTGFGIDLWNAVAARLNVKTNYQLFYDPAALFAAMRTKAVDIVGSPVAVTTARDAEFDFSLPIMQAGLQIRCRQADDRDRKVVAEDVGD